MLQPITAHALPGRRKARREAPGSKDKEAFEPVDWHGCRQFGNQRFAQFAVIAWEETGRQRRGLVHRLRTSWAGSTAQASMGDQSLFGKTIDVVADCYGGEVQIAAQVGNRRFAMRPDVLEYSKSGVAGHLFLARRGL